MQLLSDGLVSSADLHYLEILGHGSGGTVYRTFHQPSKIVMAVKVLALDVTPEEQKQIKAELEILHKVGSIVASGRRVLGTIEGGEGRRTFLPPLNYPPLS